MDHYCDYPIDKKYTDLLGYPGLTVVKHSDPHHRYAAFYIPDEDIICSIHGCKANKNGFAKERVLFDVYDDGEKFCLICLAIQRQRYYCPLCRGDVQYETPYTDTGKTASKRLAKMLAEVCLEKSAQEISDELHGELSKSQIQGIYKRYSQTVLKKHFSNLLLPTKIGIHSIFFDYERRYYILTDLDNGSVIEVFDDSNVQAMNSFIGQAQRGEIPKVVVSALDDVCIGTARCVPGGKLSISVYDLFKKVTDFVRENILLMRKYIIGRVMHVRLQRHHYKTLCARNERSADRRVARR